jgi:hypothetical protein
MRRFAPGNREGVDVRPAGPWRAALSSCGWSGGEWGSALEVPYAAEMRGMTGADRLMGASLFRPLSSLYLSSLRHGLSFR